MGHFILFFLWTTLSVFAAAGSPKAAPSAAKGAPPAKGSSHTVRPPTATSRFNPMTFLAIERMNALTQQAAKNPTLLNNSQFREALNRSSIEVSITNQLFKQDAQSGKYDASDQMGVLSKNAGHIEDFVPEKPSREAKVEDSHLPGIPVLSRVPPDAVRMAPPVESSIAKVRDYILERSPSLTPQAALSQAIALKEKDPETYHQVLALVERSQAADPFSGFGGEKGDIESEKKSSVRLLEKFDEGPAEKNADDGSNVQLGNSRVLADAMVAMPAAVPILQAEATEMPLLDQLTDFIHKEYRARFGSSAPFLSAVGQRIRTEIGKILSKQLDPLQKALAPLSIDNATLGGLFLAILALALAAAAAVVFRVVGRKDESLVEVHLLTSSSAPRVLSIERDRLQITKCPRGFELREIYFETEWRCIGLLAPGSVASAQTLNDGPASLTFRLTPAQQWVTTSDVEQYFIQVSVDTKAA